MRIAQLTLDQHDYQKALDEVFRLGKAIGLTWMKLETEGPGWIDRSSRACGAPRNPPKLKGCPWAESPHCVQPHVCPLMGKCSYG